MREISLAETPLDAQMRSELAALLAAAFHDDAIMVHMLGRSKWHRIASAYFSLQVRYPDIVLTVTDAGRLAGVLLASTPEARHPGFGHLLLSYWLLRNAYTESQNIAHRIALQVPHSPHWYINLIAIHPDFQHRHHGAALLDRFSGIAGNMDIYVDCEPGIGPFYRRAGYEEIARISDPEMLIMGRQNA